MLVGLAGLAHREALQRDLVQKGFADANNRTFATAAGLYYVSGASRAP